MIKVIVPISPLARELYYSTNLEGGSLKDLVTQRMNSNIESKATHIHVLYMVQVDHEMLYADSVQKRRCHFSRLINAILGTLYLIVLYCFPLDEIMKYSIQCRALGNLIPEEYINIVEC